MSLRSESSAQLARPVTFTILFVAFVLAALAGPRSLGSAAQESTPMPGVHDIGDMPAGNVGLTSVVLARVVPPTAPDQELQLARVDVAPGATVSAHTHPGTIALCLESGSVVFGVAMGTVTLTHADNPEAAEQVDAGDETVLQPGDCLTFDATQTVHTLYNPGEAAVIWQAHLYDPDEPPTTFLATPAP